MQFTISISLITTASSEYSVCGKRMHFIDVDLHQTFAVNGAFSRAKRLRDRNAHVVTMHDALPVARSVILMRGLTFRRRNASVPMIEGLPDTHGALVKEMILDISGQWSRACGIQQDFVDRGWRIAHRAKSHGLEVEKRTVTSTDVFRRVQNVSFVEKPTGLTHYSQTQYTCVSKQPRCTDKAFVSWTKSHWRTDFLISCVRWSNQWAQREISSSHSSLFHDIQWYYVTAIDGLCKERCLFY